MTTNLIMAAWIFGLATNLTTADSNYFHDVSYSMAAANGLGKEPILKWKDCYATKDLNIQVSDYSLQIQSNAMTVAIVIETNNVPRWKSVECHDGPGSWMMWIDEMSRGQPMVDSQSGRMNCVQFPTGTPDGVSNSQRVRIVSIKRRTVLNMTWFDKPERFIREELLDEKRILLIKKEDWQEAESRER